MIYGMGGDDRLTAHYYSNRDMYGGDGADILDHTASNGLSGNLYGGADADIIHGRHDDTLYGGSGNDTLDGDLSGDIYGDDGNDVISVRGAGLPRDLYGGAGDDVIHLNNDLGYGGAGADIITGTNAYSTFYSFERDLDDMGLEHDQLFGGTNSDTFWAGYGDDVYGGGGFSPNALNLSLGGATAGVSLDIASLLGGRAWTLGGGVLDDIDSLVSLRGTEFADTLTLAAQFNNIKVNAGAGDDLVIGTTTTATVNGGDGDDSFTSGSAAEVFDGGAGMDTVDYSRASAGALVNLVGGIGPNGDRLSQVENVIGSAFNDTLTGDDGANLLQGGSGSDALSGGGNVDTAVFSGAMSAYTITRTANGLTVAGPDGTDTLTGIEFLKFADQAWHYQPGTAVTLDFNTAPSTYAGALRDFDGNDLGGSSAWVLAGHVDIQGDGDQEYILFNQQIGRWATIGPAADGKVYFEDHGWAGDTRVVGIYIDPEVQLGHAALGGPNDSQRRFQNDLNIGNIKGILGAGDYNHDGRQEVYFSLTDGTAYLHAYMHADGNIQYANYQDQAQVTAYLAANGYDHTTWDGWF